MNDEEINKKFRRLFDRLDRIETVIDNGQEQENDLIDARQMRHLTKLSDKSIYRYRKNGTFPSYRFGRKIYYLRSEIIRILCDSQNLQ